MASPRRALNRRQRKHAKPNTAHTNITNPKLIKVIMGKGKDHFLAHVAAIGDGDSRDPMPISISGRGLPKSKCGMAFLIVVTLMEVENLK